VVKQGRQGTATTTWAAKTTTPWAAQATTPSPDPCRQACGRSWAADWRRARSGKKWGRKLPEPHAHA
jgi:hypothetical protein